MSDRGELADLLAAWRRRLTPAAAGLPQRSSRLTGLRREEVAVLADLSVDYVVRLEQGKARRPSREVSSALAEALGLSASERAQLFIAAGLPAPLPGRAPTEVPDSVQRLLTRAPDIAIGVYTVYWTLLTANRAWVSFLGEPAEGFNLVEAQFTGASPTVEMSPAYVDRFERALVTDVRDAVLRYPDDSDVRTLCERLRRIERFERLWSDGSSVEQRSEAKTFRHPVVGPITVDCDVYSAIGTDLRIITYTVDPGSEDASRFALVQSLGQSAPEWSAGTGR